MKQETNLKKHLNSCEEYQGPRRSAIVDKQETLEEFIKSIYPSPSGAKIKGIELGAKWQQERSYSEEDMREAIFTSFLLGVDRGNYSKELEDDLLKKFEKK